MSTQNYFTASEKICSIALSYLVASLEQTIWPSSSASPPTRLPMYLLARFSASAPVLTNTVPTRVRAPPAMTYSTS